MARATKYTVMVHGGKKTVEFIAFMIQGTDSGDDQ